MKFAYLVQGAAQRLRDLALPPGALVFALCYDEDTSFDFARSTIFDPVCSWAQGRNRLVEVAMAAVPDIDYLILSDDDAHFTRGSFKDFERNIARTRPLLAQPLMPKARTQGGYNRLVRAQAALLVDEQVYAIHRSVVGTKGVCPIVTEYDHVSWHAPCLIFEYAALSTFGRHFHQYNDVVVENVNHTWEAGGTNYLIGKPGEAYRCFQEWVSANCTGYDETILNAYWRHGHRGSDKVRFGMVRAARLALSTIRKQRRSQ